MFSLSSEGLAQGHENYHLDTAVHSWGHVEQAPSTLPSPEGSSHSMTYSECGDEAIWVPLGLWAHMGLLVMHRATLT